MPPALELISTVIRFRADAIFFAVVALIAIGGSRTYLRKRITGEIPGIRLLAVIAFIMLSALLADGAALLHGYPDPATIETVAWARGITLGVAALLGAVLLAAATHIMVLRAELQSHANIERELQHAKLAADEASRAKTDFLAVVSHEIRTPLNAVMGFANLLANSRLDDAQRGYVSTITTEGARLGVLLNDILDLTKIEKGRLLLERLPFAPVETAQEVMRLLSPRAADKKIELRFEAQLAGPLLVAGDPLRFRQVILNLVDNAIKFTPRGTVTLFMTWTAPRGAESAGHLAVAVRDTGIGIPADKVKDLFQMFMQADNSTTRRYGGTGLGLAICQRLVMLMGGEITVQSTPGQGSEFSFSLPMALFAFPAEQTPSVAATPEAPASRGRPARILIVDDLETNRLLLEIFLRRSGFEPQVAAGGEEAVRLALENRYDAILMDLQMPEVDGYTATRRIRASETNGRHTPIIALTASLARGTREKCIAAGMDEHLTKPLDLPRFRAVLSTFLSQAAVR